MSVLRDLIGRSIASNRGTLRMDMRDAAFTTPEAAILHTEDGRIVVWP